MNGGTYMATLKDVAARAGVSIAAVSYCINGTHNLNPETKARIQNAIKELNYIPNSQARNLKRQASRELCAIFPDLENLCYNEFLKGILIQAENSHYSINISCSYNDISQEQALIKNAVSKHYAGIFLVTCQPQNTEFFQDIQQHHPIEIVFLERLPEKMDVIYYGFDNYKTLHYLTTQLIQNGYQDIALLTGSSRHFSESECISGFQDAMETAGISIDENRILTSDTTKEGAFSAFLHSWVNTPPQAIITSSQALCQGVIEACNLTMNRIPQDICIITLDVENWNRSSFYPDIIRTSRPAYSLGKESCKALIEAIEKPEKTEDRFHLIQDTISRYPLQLPAPRRRGFVPSADAIGTLNVAVADMPTVQALKAISHEFFNEFRIHLNFDFFTFRELFTLIQEDSRREQPDYDIYLYDTSWFSYLFQSGCLKDITDDFYTSPESTKYFLPKFLSNCCRDGRYYGFPIVGGTQFLIYRRDLFSRQDLCLKYQKDHNLSLRPPKTWKEFNSIARFFTREYNPESPTLYGTAIGIDLNEELALEFEARMWGHGGNFYDHHGHLCMNSPQNISAMSNFMESFRYSPQSVSNNLEAFMEFVKGDAAMVITFSEYATQIQRTHSEYLYKNGYSMIPSRTPANVGWHLGVSNNCRRLPFVLQFFHWLYRRHISYYMSILGGASALEFPYKNHELLKTYPWLSLSPDSVQVSRSRLYPLKKKHGFLAPNEFEGILCEGIRSMPQGPQEISECLNAMQKKVIHLLAQ